MSGARQRMNPINHRVRVEERRQLDRRCPTGIRRNTAGEGEESPRDVNTLRVKRVKRWERRVRKLKYTNNILNKDYEHIRGPRIGGRNIRVRDLDSPLEWRRDEPNVDSPLEWRRDTGEGEGARVPPSPCGEGGPAGGTGDGMGQREER